LSIQRAGNGNADTNKIFNPTDPSFGNVGMTLKMNDVDGTGNNGDEGGWRIQHTKQKLCKNWQA
jgi:hypothetical protein